MLWQAYTWVLVATLIAIPFYRMGAARLAAAGRKTLRRAPRPAFAAAVYFAIAFVLNHSGKAPAVADGKPGWAMGPDGLNMVKVVADASAGVFGQAYAGVAAFLGLLGGFISGSEASSIAMLSKLHFETMAQVFAGDGPGAAAAHQPAGGGGERHRRRAGLGHLAGQAAERGGGDRPDRHGEPGHPRHRGHRRSSWCWPRR